MQDQEIKTYSTICDCWNCEFVGEIEGLPAGVKANNFPCPNCGCYKMKPVDPRERERLSKSYSFERFAVSLPKYHRIPSLGENI